MFKHLTVNSCAEFCENRLQVLSIHRFLDELPLGINEFTSLGARLSTHNKETWITHEDIRSNVLHLIRDPLHCRKRSTTKVKKDVCTKGNWRSLFLFILLKTLTRSLSNHMDCCSQSPKTKVDFSQMKMNGYVYDLNPLHPHISMHILRTDLFKFSRVPTRRTLTIQSFFSWWSFPLFYWP